MRILILHSSYRSGPVSGENRVVADEARLLADAGHGVEVWAPTPDTERGLGSLARAAIDTVWSRSSVAMVKRLLRTFRPDIVHVHNLFPTLSPAIVRAAAHQGVRVVMTLHNYRLMCLPATLYRAGSICEDCIGRVPWRGVLRGTYRGSRAASLVLGSSLTLHRALGSFGGVTLYLAISDFIRRKHIEAGLPGDRLVVKPNFSWPAIRRSVPGDYFLYLGRLAPEKGITEMASSWDPSLGRLVVVGDGPEAEALRHSAGRAVEFRGPLLADEVPSVVAGARALLVPSVWHEGAGKVVIEAYASGVPVLASRIGALPEFIEDDVSGYLLPPRNFPAWRAAIRRLLASEESARLGDGALRLWAQRYSPQRGLEALEQSYEEALKRPAPSR